jgi:hypothetical protein
LERGKKIIHLKSGASFVVWSDEIHEHDGAMHVIGEKDGKEVTQYRFEKAQIDRVEDYPS